MNLNHAKPGINLEDMTNGDLIRLCVGAAAYMEDIKDPAEVAALVRELRNAGGPYFEGDGLAFSLDGTEYTLMDLDLAEAYARSNIEEFANQQANELTVRMNKCGINSMYVAFDYNMFVRDRMMDWGHWVYSSDGHVEEYAPLTVGADGKMETFGWFSIWRND